MASSVFWRTLGMGVVAGMRSMAAPALLNGALQRHPSARLQRAGGQCVQGRATGYALKLLAGAEMIGDKLPNAPNRTEPISVVGRALSGGLVGGALYGLNRQSMVKGILLGGLGAVAGTFGAYAARQQLGRTGELPEPWPGVLEDLIVVFGGKGLLSNYRPRA